MNVKICISMPSEDFEWLRDQYGSSPSKAVQKLIAERKREMNEKLITMSAECGR